MRRFIAFALTFFSSLTLFSSYGANAKAESEPYYRIIDEITPFFADENQTELLFYLPYTYYVKILSVNGNTAHIEYGNIAIDGYTYFDKLFREEQSVLLPYPDVSVKTQKSTLLYQDKECLTPVKYVFAERTMRFYGKALLNNSYVYYVEYNGEMGYVSEESLYPFTVEPHKNPFTFITEENPDQKPKTNNSLPFKIIIFSCLGLSGIIAIFISIKNKKSPEKLGDYYEENDFE